MSRELLDCAIRAARAAGEIQRRARAEGVRVEVKGAADVVTETDRACERAIYDAVKARFPAHGFVGEEGAARASAEGVVWVVDPLDGTKNFAHGSLRCAVSIAVTRGTDTLVAAVYAPFVDELYTASRGDGAHRNGETIRVSTIATLRGAMVASALTYAGSGCDPTTLARLARVFASVQALRSTGCAALDLADVACGRSDAFFEPGLAAWDTAAGALLVREAGGAVTRFDGAEHGDGDPDVIASNGVIHEALRGCVMGG